MIDALVLQPCLVDSVRSLEVNLSWLFLIVCMSSLYILDIAATKPALRRDIMLAKLCTEVCFFDCQYFFDLFAAAGSSEITFRPIASR